MLFKLLLWVIYPQSSKIRRYLRRTPILGCRLLIVFLAAPASPWSTQILHRLSLRHLFTSEGTQIYSTGVDQQLSPKYSVASANVQNSFDKSVNLINSERITHKYATPYKQESPTAEWRTMYNNDS